VVEGQMKASSYSSSYSSEALKIEREQDQREAITLDMWLLSTTLVLLGISVLMVYSTTAIISQETHGSGSYLVLHHLASIGLGLVAMFIFSRIPLGWWFKNSIWLLALGYVLLILVMIPGVGHKVGGAQRWLSLGPLRIQPGEVLKLLVVLYLSSFIGRQHGHMKQFVKGTAVPFGIVCSVAGLLLLQPDFGSSVIIMLVSLCQIFTVANIFHLLGIGGAGLVLFAIAAISSPYRMRRIQAFIDPFQDASNSGYQLIQSLIAVGSGGLTGAGLGGGSQKLFYLPAAHTDFIYAVIAEELGFVGAVSVLILYIVLGVTGLRIAKRNAANPYCCSLAIGCTALIVVPALLNMGVVTGLLPTKGLVLPLLAYGGTAMIVHLALIGILLALAHKKNF